MLSLAWLTVFIIFVYVPGSKLNVIESSSSLLLSKPDSEAKSDTSTIALVSSSLVPGDDYAKEKLILRTNNKTGALTALNVITATAITKNTTARKFQEQHTQIEEVSDKASHSVITKDPSSSPSSSSLSSSSLLNIQLTQATTSTSETPTTTNTTTAIITRTTTNTTTETAIRTWNILNDIGDNKNYNGQRSNSIYWQQEQEREQQQHQPPPLPPPSAQQQKQQHNQLALLPGTQSLSLGLGPGLSPGQRNTTVLPIQLTETIQNTASVIIRGNSLNWGYVELASSESPPILISTNRPEAGITPLPLPAVPQPSSTSSASFVLSLSPSSSSYLSSSESPLPSSALPTLSSSLSSSASVSVSVSSTTSTSRTTTSTTTPKSPSLSSTDGYLNITSQAGTHAYLPCNVKQLVKKPISWLRVRDGHILTVDQTTFIADQRFQSIYTPNPERWSLQIKYVQTKDAGTYECQVSTEPKTSAIVSLNIVEPKTELIGESNRHVKAGSQVKLRCIISQALEPPLYINWYHNRQQIFLHNRKGWRTEIERDASGSANGTNNDKQSTIASLIIPSVGKKDSGNYTCSPSNSEPITVVLHVLNGEYSASAITSGCGSNSIKDVQGLQLHTLFWVISFVMCFGQLRHPYSRLLLPQWRRTSLSTAAGNQA